MADEQQQQADISNQEKSFDRTHPAFLAVTKQLAELKQKLEEEEAAKKRAAEAEERKKLEEKGQYETLVKSLQEKVAETEKRYAQELLHRDIGNALLKAGATNDIFIRGAIASYQGDPSGIAAYVSELSADAQNRVFFESQQQQGGLPPPKGVSPAGKGSGGWKEVASAMRGTDVEAASKARKAVDDYFRANGKLPDGLKE